MEAIHILLVEDNEGDIILTKEAFKEAKLLINLSVVKDGKEAIDLLTMQSKNNDVRLPDLLLLDVNLPKRNGHEVLKYIKEDEYLKHIPVIMLTTSSSPRDINLAYKNYATNFITKPLDINELMCVIAKIDNFWISIIKPPKKIENINEAKDMFGS